MRATLSGAAVLEVLEILRGPAPRHERDPEGESVARPLLELGLRRREPRDRHAVR